MDKRTVALNQLRLGMYVLDIPEHKDLALKQHGFIRDTRLLALLRKKGVKSVVIDASRSGGTMSSPQTPAAPQQQTPTKTAHSPKAKSSLEQELPRARKLYQQTRQLQQRMMQDVKLGKQLDLRPVEQLADEFIHSVFRNSSALSCLRLIKDKDDYLLEHSIGVAILMTMFGRHLGYAGEVLHQICVGSLLHDIGKVLIPEAILNKPGRLTEAEFDEMKKHAAHSRDIIAETPGISKVSLDVAALHHEKLDGSGYPDGLKGGEISIYGRMITICDIYDAMTADRVYHRGLPPAVALKRLMEMTPNQLDKLLVQNFIQCVGVYPPGSLVELSNGLLAVVIEDNPKQPLKPRVKSIYNPRTRTHVMATLLDLAASNQPSIVNMADPQEHKLNLDDYL